MEINTNDLILRTVTENDIGEIARMWEYPHETTIDKAYEALKYMGDTHSKNRKKSICHLCLGVFQKQEPNRIIGWCGLDGEAELGKTVLFYMIDEKYRNRGYATQCAMELINYGFEKMEYDILYGGCAKDNVGSYRVMQKAGMVQDSFYENGDYIFSIDRETFLKRRIHSMPVMLERKVIYESDWVVLYADKVKMPDGRIFDSYHKLHYPHESISVVIINEKDEIMMIQSKRYITSRLEWEIPAGRIEENETPEEAARRECLEETGCILKDLNYLCCYNPNNGMSDLKMHLFMARVETETSDIDENEVNAKRWVSKEEVLEILKNNRSQCGISMLGLLYTIQFCL